MRLFHRAPENLVFALVAPDGSREVVLERPVGFDEGTVRARRTTSGFEGTQAAGTWFIEIREIEPESDSSQWTEWAQVVVGLSSDPPEERPSWGGTACSTDDECGFDHRGTPGQCYRTGDQGFCTLPCEGYCPYLLRRSRFWLGHVRDDSAYVEYLLRRGPGDLPTDARAIRRLQQRTCECSRGMLLVLNHSGRVSHLLNATIHGEKDVARDLRAARSLDVE